MYDAKKRGAGAVDDGDSSCAVCLAEFRDGETLRLLPRCGHAFHRGCIDTWLHTHVNCPLCCAPTLLPPPPIPTPRRARPRPRQGMSQREILAPSVAFKPRRPQAPANRSAPSSGPHRWWRYCGGHGRTSRSGRGRGRAAGLRAGAVAGAMAVAWTSDGASLVGTSDEEDEEADAGVHHVWYIRTKGLDERAIAAITAVVYDAKKCGAGAVDDGDSSGAVCLAEFRDGETLRLLPRCGHAFHR
ncbi:hypothetical protein BAE44_0013410, partial [Dichanthelium oligosanthes]